MRDQVGCIRSRDLRCVWKGQDSRDERSLTPFAAPDLDDPGGFALEWWQRLRLSSNCDASFHDKRTLRKCFRLPHPSRQRDDHQLPLPLPLRPDSASRSRRVASEAQVALRASATASRLREARYGYGCACRAGEDDRGAERVARSSGRWIGEDLEGDSILMDGGCTRLIPLHAKYPCTRCRRRRTSRDLSCEAARLDERPQIFEFRAEQLPPLATPPQLSLNANGRLPITHWWRSTIRQEAVRSGPLRLRGELLSSLILPALPNLLHTAQEAHRPCRFRLQSSLRARLLWHLHTRHERPRGSKEEQEAQEGGGGSW